MQTPSKYATWVKPSFSAGAWPVTIQGNRVTVGDISLTLSHASKVLWPESALTKVDLAAYYLEASPFILPFLSGRPLTLQSYPDGITEPSIYVKQRPKGTPDWVADSCLPARAGHEVCYISVDNTAVGVATLAWLANRNSIPLHAWLAREDRPEQPDWVAFDLDPAEGSDFRQVVAIAKWLHQRLDDLGLRSFAKVSGSRGIHVMAPLAPESSHDEVRSFATGVAEEVVAALPNDATLRWPVEERRGKVFLDIRRNTYGHHIVAPYSVRAKPGAPVSVPLDWAEVDDPALSPTGWDMGATLERLAAVGDPMAPGYGLRQRLPAKPRAK